MSGIQTIYKDVEAIRALSVIKQKILQSVRIRRAIVVRKLNLLEDFNKLPQQEKPLRLQTFLKEYEIILTREEKVADLFRRGVNNGIEILKELGGDWNIKDYDIRGERETTIWLLSDISRILGRYESRMSRERSFIFKAASDQKRLAMITDFHKDLKLEVVGDLEFVQALKKKIPELVNLSNDVGSKITTAKEKFLALKQGLAAGLNLYLPVILVPYTFTSLVAFVIASQNYIKSNNAASAPLQKLLENPHLQAIFGLEVLIVVGGLSLAIAYALTSAAEKKEIAEILSELANVGTLEKMSLPK